MEAAMYPMTQAAMPTITREGAARWLKVILGAVLLFNLIDAVLTIALVHTETAVEANPLMSVLLDASPSLFMALKLALVSFGVAVIWRFRDRVVARAGAIGVFSAYALLMAWHSQSVVILPRVLFS